MRDVKPLKTGDRVGYESPRPAAVARQSRAARRATLVESLHGSVDEPIGDDIAFRRPSVPERTLRQLRGGRFSIEDEVDLHGLNRAQAHEALKAFIAQSCRRGVGCVRVIHGKGSGSGPDGPVLKGLVREYLARWDAVLAVATAVARHGGSGAVYVLLRRG